MMMPAAFAAIIAIVDAAVLLPRWRYAPARRMVTGDGASAMALFDMIRKILLRGAVLLALSLLLEPLRARKDA